MGKGKNRWDYKHPARSFYETWPMPSGNEIAGVSFLKKCLIVRCYDLFGSKGTDQERRRKNLSGHATQINDLLSCLYDIDQDDYRYFESFLHYKLISMAESTDLESFDKIAVVFHFRKVNMELSRTQGQKTSIVMAAYTGKKWHKSKPAL